MLFEAVLGCDAPIGHMCYYTFFDEAAVPSLFLQIPGGQRLKVPVYDHQNYVYVVTIDTNRVDAGFGEYALGEDARGFEIGGIIHEHERLERCGGALAAAARPQPVRSEQTA